MKIWMVWNLGNCWINHDHWIKEMTWEAKHCYVPGLIWSSFSTVPNAWEVAGSQKKVTCTWTKFLGRVTEVPAQTGHGMYNSTHWVQLGWTWQGRVLWWCEKLQVLMWTHKQWMWIAWRLNQCQTKLVYTLISWKAMTMLKQEYLWRHGQRQSIRNVFGNLALVQDYILVTMYGWACESDCDLSPFRYILKWKVYMEIRDWNSMFINWLINCEI